MIFTILFYIVGLFATVIGIVLPDLQLWPDIVFQGIGYVVNALLNTRVILFFIPTLLAAFVFYIRIISYLLIYIIVRKIFNYIRGAGEGL